MKNYIKVIVYILSFLIIIIAAVFGYKYLTNNYVPEENIEEVSSKKAEDFTVLNNNEEKVKLSDFFGKPIVVNFWATWCGPCRGELPEFEEYYKKYNGEIEFLMVNLTDGYNDTVEGVKEFVKKNNYEFPVYFDIEYSASNTYKLYSIPQTLFIDREGNIIKTYIGMINKDALENYINELKED